METVNFVIDFTYFWIQKVVRIAKKRKVTTLTISPIAPIQSPLIPPKLERDTLIKMKVVSRGMTEKIKSLQCVDAILRRKT